MGDIGLLAIAAANAINAYQMARRQLKLLKQQVRLSENYLNYYIIQRDFYRDTFQNYVEVKIREAVYGPTSQLFTPDYSAQYSTALDFGIAQSNRYNILTLGRGSLIPQFSYYARRGQMYSLPGFTDIQSVNYISQAISTHRVDVITHLYRYEEYKENIYNQRRFERYSAIATYANKSSMTIASEGTSSFAYLNQALEAKGNMYGAASNDLFSFAGDAYQSAQGKSKLDTIFKAPKIGSTAENYSQRQEKNVTSPTWQTMRDGPTLK